MADTPQDVRERQKEHFDQLRESPTGEELIQEDDPDRAAELRRVQPEAYDPRLDPQHQDPVRLPQDVREVREQMGAEFENEWGVDSERAQERQEGRQIDQPTRQPVQTGQAQTGEAQTRSRSSKR